jgi:hypothetical protein
MIELPDAVCACGNELIDGISFCEECGRPTKLSVNTPLSPDPPKTGISVGDASLKISIDADSVDEFIVRLERSVAAFKAEWNRRISA